MAHKESLHRKGRVFVISAPSGTGKTTLVNKLLEETRGLTRSVSVTTRRRRRGEAAGRDYHFISRRHFDELREKKELLEWAQVFGNFYGTPRKAIADSIKNGNDILLEIDVQGAMQVKEKINDAALIFILPPSKEILEERLMRRRTESAPEIKRRLSVAEHEMRFIDRYDYTVINNTIQDAARELKRIIAKEREKE